MSFQEQSAGVQVDSADGEGAGAQGSTEGEVLVKILPAPPPPPPQPPLQRSLHRPLPPGPCMGAERWQSLVGESEDRNPQEEMKLSRR